MRAQVRGFLVVDDPDESPGPVLVQVFAGPADGPGEESFQVEVVSVDALASMLEHSPVLPGRHLLIMRDLDLRVAEAFLRARFEELSAETWPELAEKLGRIGSWEFEDYQA
jgi:hypothetical protein